MRLWRILAVAAVAMTFTAAAQAECGGLHRSALKSASSEASGGKTAPAKVAASKPSAGTLSSTRVASRPARTAGPDMASAELPGGGHVSR